MGGVIIAPNLRKEKTFIDENGNEVVPYTKQVLKRNEPEYKPSPEEVAGKIEAKKKAGRPSKKVEQPSGAKPKNPLAEMIKKQVQKAVADSMADLNIGEMVQEAIAEAFEGEDE
jgi:hypothetical protein